eukprot:m51a1_g13059 hypothetical protein (177) ;mRNA; f:1234-1832
MGSHAGVLAGLGAARTVLLLLSLLLAAQTTRVLGGSVGAVDVAVRWLLCCVLSVAGATCAALVAALSVACLLVALAERQWPSPSGRLWCVRCQWALIVMSNGQLWVCCLLYRAGEARLAQHPVLPAAGAAASALCAASACAVAAMLAASLACHLTVAGKTSSPSSAVAEHWPSAAV